MPQDKPEIGKEIATKVIANTITLVGDFVVDGGTYGLGFTASARVKEVTFKELRDPRVWLRGYHTTWQVLKWGFYPAFLAEVAAAEAGKHFKSPISSELTETLMPGLVGTLITPASSLAAINQLRPLDQQLNFTSLLRTEGLRGISRVSAGATVIGLREWLCFWGLHHPSHLWSNAIAESSQKYHFLSTLFSRQDGSPTIAAKGIVAFVDISAILASQPLSILASNAAIYKSKQFGAPVVSQSYLASRATFWSGVTKQIITEGEKNGLSPARCLGPGFAMRMTSFVGMYTLFKNGYKPIEDFTRENITFKKN